MTAALNDLTRRAKVAGEALVAAMECDADPDVARCARYVSLNASAVSLAKLGRLLK